MQRYNGTIYHDALPERVYASRQVEKQKHHLSREQLQTVVKTLPGCPILLNHNPKNGTFGRVVSASMDANNHARIQFEIFNGRQGPFNVNLVGAISRGDFRFLSLTHLIQASGAVVGVEVSVVKHPGRSGCYIDEGAPPPTDAIRHMIQASNADRKGGLTYCEVSCNIGK